MLSYGLHGYRHMILILFILYLGCSDQSDCIFVADIPAQASERPRSEYSRHGINKICPCHEEYVMRYILGEGQCMCEASEVPHASPFSTSLASLKHWPSPGI